MTPLKAIKIIGIGLAVIGMAACGDSKIAAVKDSRIRGDEFTFGETLEKIKECKSTEWTSEVAHNATIVTHTCTVKVSDELRDRAKEGELAALKIHAGLANNSVNSALRGARYAQADAKRLSEERENRAAKELAEMDGLIKLTAEATWSPWVSLTGAPLTRPGTPPGPGVWEAKLQAEVAVLTKQKEAVIATIEVERQKSAEAAQTLQNEIDDLAQWSDKFEREIALTHAAVVKDVDAYYKKSHYVKVKTSFRYREGGNAELLRSTFVVNDVQSEGTIPVYLMDPKRMSEYLIYMVKYGLGMNAPDLFDERFPIEAAPGADAGSSTYRYKGAKPAT